MFEQFQQLFSLLQYKPLPEESIWRIPFEVELLFWLAVLMGTLILFLWQPRWIGEMEESLARFSRRRIQCVALVGLLALGMRAAALPWVPIPLPTVHVELSYFLQAKTFASGRLTNPTHPMWVHFETYHVNMRPTYQSMYPPGQAMFMTLGMKLFGHPWFGVWLSVGMMCAAVCWMLQGWMPPQWALLGGLFCVLRFSLFGPWIDTYYGGTGAALGGALVLGALPRIQKGKALAWNSVLFAFGLVLLANIRMYEGLVFSLLPLGSLLLWLFQRGKSDPAVIRKVAACFLAVCVPAALAMLYYNWRGTGHPFVMPYMLNQQTYHISRPFLWQTRYNFPHYNHFMMRKFYYFHELPDYLDSRHLYGIIDITEKKFSTYYGLLLWPLVIAVIPTCWIALKSRRLRLLILTGLALLGGLLLVIWPPERQYPSPALCVVVAILVLCVRLARTIKLGKFHIGPALSRAMAGMVLVLMMAIACYTFINPLNLGNFETRFPYQIDKARIFNELSAMPGKHLVIVHAHLDSAPGYDWVYNEPDIDHSKVVWARDMGTAKNQELVDYFSDRHIWFVDQNVEIRLFPYDQRPMAPIENYAAIPSKVGGATQLAQAHQEHPAR